MKHTAFFLDSAEHVFQVCQIKKHGDIIFNKAMSLEKVAQFLTVAKPYIIAMKSYGGFHHWARLAQK
jgi:transposase